MELIIQEETVTQTGHSTSAAQQLLELASQLGVEYIFSNLGSDHPAFIEAFARIDEIGGKSPKIIICPHEMTALTAAHGYAMVTRKPQMVLVHVDVGTQNLGCSIHNAARARVPAIIIAGLSPVTVNGDQVGARTEFIHYTQDAPRQHDIAAQYMKWSYELRAPEMVDSVLLRAIQVSTTMPEGPVYLTGAREVWDGQIPASREVPKHWPAADTGGLRTDALKELLEALRHAERPLLITTYVGRQPAAVEHLIALSERFGIAVCEVAPQYMNFPGTHPNHVGYRRNSLVSQADLILMVDVDVPWIVSKTSPATDAKLFHIDSDPIKQGLGFWHFPAHRSYQADSLYVLRQLLEMEAGGPPTAPDVNRKWIDDAKRQIAAAPLPTAVGAPDDITVRQLSLAVRELLNERSVVVCEEPSGTETILSTLRMSRPGSYYVNGGSGLGWGINAAIGIKLAKPDAEVISLIGDGSYVFGVPSSAYWVGETYQAPQLTIIYNNRGWNSPKVSTLLVHPEGTAQRNDRYWITSGANARLADIAAAASGAAAFRVVKLADLPATLQQAMEIVRGGRSAVVEVLITPVSAQVLK